MNISHRLLLGDCFKSFHLVRDHSIDLIVTDPPYGQDYSTGRRRNTVRKTTRIANDEGGLDVERLVWEFDRVAKPASHCYIFTSWKTVDDWKVVFEKHFVLKNILIWSKDNHTAGDLHWSYAQSYEMILFGMKGRKKLHGKRDRDSVYYPKIKSHEQKHLLQKPEPLIEYLITKSSDPYDMVLDPFAGSGTVGTCCARTLRNSIQFEMAARYRSVIQRRLREEAAKSPVQQTIRVL